MIFQIFANVPVCSFLQGYELEENRTVCQAMEKAVDNFMSDGAQRMDGDDGDVQDALILT